MDGGAWRAAVHGVAQSRTQLKRLSSSSQYRRYKRCRSGKSPGGGNGNPLRFFYLENPMDRVARRATVYGVEKESDTTECTHTHAHTRTHTHTHTQTGGSREGLPLLASWDPGLRRESLSWLLKGEKDPKWDYISGQQLAAHA